jgi:hypothetical protein
VVPSTRSIVAQDNAQANDRRDLNGGRYGADTCKLGFVWREAFTGDHVCVPPSERSRAKMDNENAHLTVNSRCSRPSGARSNADEEA